MEIFEVIKEPWRRPVEYSQLVFWFVIFMIAAYAMADGMHVAITWVKNNAADALN